MAPMRSASELYPPPTTGTIIELFRLLTDELLDDNATVLRRALTADERSLLSGRLRALEPFVTIRAGDHHRRVSIAVGAMKHGFGGHNPSAEEAQIVIAQFVTSMKDLPAWSVERACHRFSTGDVKPAEVGEREISRSFGPTTAQLHIVALTLYAPVLKEYGRLGRLLRGRLPPAELTPEQRAKTAAKFDSLLGEVATAMSMSKLDDFGEVRRQEERKEAQHRAAIEAKRMEYVRRGLPAPEGDLFPSLSMVLASGYTIEYMPEAVLVAPVHGAGRPLRRI